MKPPKRSVLSQLRLLRDRLQQALENEEDPLELFPLEELKYACDICELLYALNVCDVLRDATPDEDDD